MCVFWVASCRPFVPKWWFVLRAPHGVHQYGTEGKSSLFSPHDNKRGEDWGFLETSPRPMTRFWTQGYLPLTPAANPVHILKIKPERDDVAAQASRIGMYRLVFAGVHVPACHQGHGSHRDMFFLVGGVSQYCGCDLTS
jgi:hypothetical protein